MEIRPTPEQEAFIRQAIDAGRIARPEDAATQAMALSEERERRRAEILTRVHEAEVALARGEGTVITPETMDTLAEDVKRRAAPAWTRRTPGAADGASPCATGFGRAERHLTRHRRRRRR